MRYLYTAILSTILLLNCGTRGQTVPSSNQSKLDTVHTFTYDTNYVATRFRNPVGNPPGKGYYDAQPFMRNTHLGEDWNGNGGGNSDLGDTVYACANGYINFAEDIQGGWGNVVRIRHQLPTVSMFKEVESLYAHFDSIFVQPNQYIKIGEPIGTIGTAGGIYPAHLHFELRHQLDMDIGGGYSADTSGFLNPKMFIKEFNARAN